MKTNKQASEKLQTLINQRRIETEKLVKLIYETSPLSDEVNEIKTNLSIIDAKEEMLIWFLH